MFNWATPDLFFLVFMLAVIVIGFFDDLNDGFKAILHWINAPDGGYETFQPRESTSFELSGVTTAKLAPYEARREMLYWCTRALYAVGVLILVVGYLGFQGHFDIGLQSVDFIEIAVVCASLSIITAAGLVWNYNYKVRNILVEFVSEQYALHYKPHVTSDFLLRLFRQTKLVPPYARHKHHFAIVGRLNTYAIRIEQLEITRRSKGQSHKNNSVVFKGPLIHITLPRPVDTFVYICPDSRLDRHSLGLNLPKDARRCALEDPTFERNFEVFANDQLKARTILTPLYLEKFLRLKSLWPKAAIHAVMFDNNLMLSFNRTDLFPPKSLRIPLTDPSRVAAIHASFQALSELVDATAPYQRADACDDTSSGRRVAPSLRCMCIKVGEASHAHSCCQPHVLRAWGLGRNHQTGLFPQYAEHITVRAPDTVILDRNQETPPKP